MFQNLKELGKLEFKGLFVTELTKGCPNFFSQVGNELPGGAYRLDKMEFEGLFVTELTKGCPNFFSQVGNELPGGAYRLDKLEFN